MTTPAHMSHEKRLLIAECELSRQTLRDEIHDIQESLRGVRGLFTAASGLNRPLLTRLALPAIAAIATQKKGRLMLVAAAGTWVVRQWLVMRKKSTSTPRRR